MNSNIYCERQRGDLCRLHSINAYFGYKKIDAAEFLKYCSEYDEVIKGLKTIHKENTATRANTLLSPTDWQVVKAMETSSSVPSDISTYRSAVRSKANEIETAINACDTMDKFKALFITPTDSDGNASGDAPIYDWPD